MKLSITVTGDTVDVINRVKDDYKYGGKASVLLMTALVSLLEREHQREIEELKGQLGNVIKVPEGTLTQDTAAAREALTQGAAPEPPDEDEVF